MLLLGPFTLGYRKCINNKNILMINYVASLAIKSSKVFLLAPLMTLINWQIAANTPGNGKQAIELNNSVETSKSLTNFL